MCTKLKFNPYCFIHTYQDNKTKEYIVICTNIAGLIVSNKDKEQALKELYAHARMMVNLDLDVFACVKGFKRIYNKEL